MEIEELIRDLAGAGVRAAADDRQAEEAFAEACLRADEDPREKQRIRDINDLVDAEDALYAQALAAVNRNDIEAAELLLRSSAEAGIGDAAWLLATMLERRGRTQEALSWYRRAAIDGDPRADDKIAGLYARPETASASEPTDSPRNSASAIWSAVIKTAPDNDHLDILPSLVLPATAAALAVDSALMTDALHWLCKLPALSASQLQCNLAVRFADHYAHAIRELPRLEDRIVLLPQPAWRPMRVNPVLFPPVTVARPCDFLDAALRIDAMRLLAKGEPGSGKSILAGVVARACRPVLGGMRARAASRELAAVDMMLPLASVPATTSGATLHEAMEQALESGTQALLVTEDTDVVGVVTLTDLAQAMLQARGLPSIQRVEMLMQPPVTVPGDMPTSAVMAAAASSHAGLLVVTGPDGVPVGYLTPESLLPGVSGSAREHESQSSSRSLFLFHELLEA